jgi:hypothetical protein
MCIVYRASPLHAAPPPPRPRPHSALRTRQRQRPTDSGPTADSPQTRAPAGSWAGEIKYRTPPIAAKPVAVAVAAGAICTCPLANVPICACCWQEAGSLRLT